jgi:hypothetical protein
VLYLAAMTASRFNPPLAALYQRLRQAGKPASRPSSPSSPSPCQVRTPTAESPGSPRQLPAPGSHRSVRAGLPHTAPRIMDSLRSGTRIGPPVPVGADAARAAG